MSSEKAEYHVDDIPFSDPTIDSLLRRLEYYKTEAEWRRRDAEEELARHIAELAEILGLIEIVEAKRAEAEAQQEASMH